MITPRWLKAYRVAARGIPRTGSRVVRVLRLLGLLVLIIHCRPWSYEVLDPAMQRSPQGSDKVDALIDASVLWTN